MPSHHLWQLVNTHVKPDVYACVNYWCSQRPRNNATSPGSDDEDSPVWECPVCKRDMVAIVFVEFMPCSALPYCEQILQPCGDCGVIHHIIMCVSLLTSIFSFACLTPPYCPPTFITFVGVQNRSRPCAVLRGESALQPREL
jgi:hypothetical protein